MRIGIDLGGTKIEAIALGDDGKTLYRRRVPTPSNDYEKILSTIAELIWLLEGELKQTGTIGLAAPGAISAATGCMKKSNSTILNGRPLHQDLASKLRRPIRIENDANCFALSEAVDGAAADAKVVFGVILGTGVGGGVVIDKQIVTGRNTISGEWGHNPVPWPTDDERPGPSCYCGKSGCIETFLSGPGLARDYHLRSRVHLSPPEVVNASAAGDEVAAECLRIYQNRLARGLATIINVLDPDTIVLGGGMSNLLQLYNGLDELISRYAFADVIQTRVARARHGDSSGVRGAAWLWPVAAEPATAQGR
jgi:fructokinase